MQLNISLDCFIKMQQTRLNVDDLITTTRNLGYATADNSSRPCPAGLAADSLGTTLKCDSSLQGSVDSFIQPTVSTVAVTSSTEATAAGAGVGLGVTATPPVYSRLLIILLQIFSVFFV